MLLAAIFSNKATPVAKVPVESIEAAKIGARDIDSGRSIKSGDIFTIVRDTEHIDKCQKMFDIQWAIICAIAISGGALTPDEFGDLDKV
ncbi:unnamed protein product [Fusarium graminearum]|uniref:Uncharacterized protein n=1 Tax=Gibberella zeae TaxID=5518 RepID=A0A4E9EJA5_GIBZA|nr:unnamed protein product [Fusarium graminearum]CAF3658216.1 unnamed protein product [Fusarium graminearum]